MLEVLFEKLFRQSVTEEFYVLDKLFAVVVFAALVLFEGLSDGSLFGI